MVLVKNTLDILQVEYLRKCVPPNSNLKLRNEIEAAFERFFNADVKKQAHVSDMAAGILRTLNYVNITKEKFIDMQSTIYSGCSELLRKISLHCPEKIYTKECNFLIQTVAPTIDEKFRTILINVNKQFEKYFCSSNYRNFISHSLFLSC